ncbi:MAG TPA: copper homeostasis protein CutC [Bacteroidales bacterium]
MNPIQIEVCVNSVESAVNAQKGGATRVELCDNLLEGGTTASAGTLLAVRAKLICELNVLIRPRGGDFLYNNTELETIMNDIAFAKKAGADGIVFGFLTEEGKIDVTLLKEMITQARPLSITFHRAFDMCDDPFEALEQLIKLRVDRILTSGQKQTALEGSTLLKQLIQKAGNQIIIMPGGGIRPINIEKLIKKTGAREYHVSSRFQMESKMNFRRPDIKMGSLLEMSEYEKVVVDQAGVKEMVEIASKH